MSQPERKKAYTIVAFRYDQKDSILYKTTDDVKWVEAYTNKALTQLKADVISIRRVYDKNPME